MKLSINYDKREDKLSLRTGKGVHQQEIQDGIVEESDQRGDIVALSIANLSKRTIEHYESMLQGHYLWIYYDPLGDFLEIGFKPKISSFAEERGDGIFQLVNEETNEIEGYGIFAVTKKRGRILEATLALPRIIV